MVKVGLICAIRCENIRLNPLLHNLVAIDRVDDVVAGAVKNNDRDDTCECSHSSISDLPLLYRVWSTLTHGLQCPDWSGCCLVLYSRVNADGSKDIRIGNTQINSHGCSSRYTCHIDATGINCPLRGILFNSLDNSGNNCRFPTSARLIYRIKPVPACVLIIHVRLLWIDDNEIVLIRQAIHLRTSREVSRSLSTTMQHDDEWYGSFKLVIRWGIDKIRTMARWASVCVVLPPKIFSIHDFFLLSFSIYMHFTCNCRSCQGLAGVSCPPRQGSAAHPVPHHRRRTHDKSGSYGYKTTSLSQPLHDRGDCDSQFVVEPLPGKRVFWPFRYGKMKGMRVERSEIQHGYAIPFRCARFDSRDHRRQRPAWAGYGAWAGRGWCARRCRKS